MEGIIAPFLEQLLKLFNKTIVGNFVYEIIIVRFHIGSCTNIV